LSIQQNTQIFEVNDKFVLQSIQLRKLNSRKGENGRVAIIGGSYLYHGAPLLSALGASKTGVDLVYLAVPPTLVTPIRSYSPNFIVIPLPDGKMTKGCINKLLKWLPDVDSAVIGPGVGRQRTDGLKNLVRELCSRNVKIVLDADALRPEIASEVSGKDAVVTPHDGEFKRLFRVELDKSVEVRTKTVQDFAAKEKLTILSKGNIDIISNGSRTALNRTGTPAMTVGGTGDVLAGVVSGLIAQGMEPFAAASSGAYVTGLAGELASEHLGLHISPTDLISKLPYVLKRFDNNK